VQELEKIERIESNILRFMTIRIKNIPEENSELMQKEENK
jgi:ribosomal protein S6